MITSLVDGTWGGGRGGNNLVVGIPLAFFTSRVRRGVRRHSDLKMKMEGMEEGRVERMLGLLESSKGKSEEMGLP